MHNGTITRTAGPATASLLDVRGDHHDAVLQCARDNARLAQENEILRQSCADLTKAAETWIRLYESALARANAAEAQRPDRES